MSTVESEKFPRSLVLIMAAFALMVLTVPLLFWYQIEYFEVCPQCARKREVQQWLIPFTRIPYYTYAKIEDSPLTDKLVEFGYLEKHDHRWLVVISNGPGGDENLGEGVRVAPGLISPSIAPFVGLLHRYTDPTTEAYWFARMTHQQQSEFVRNVADDCTKLAYTNADEFAVQLRRSAIQMRQLLYARWGRVDEPQARTPPRLLYQRPPR
jgi:hypothetical protein